ncbi:MAG: histidine kinase [Bryobacteraceae bacterium]|nr:histidine kinase [Bryobacteraceae bacterium]
MALPRPARILAAFTGWTLVALIFALPQFGPAGDFAAELKRNLASWWAWGLVAIPLAWADRRLPVADAAIGQRLLYHLPLSLLFSVLVAIVRSVLAVLLGSLPIERFGPPELQQTIFHPLFLWTWLIYWLILAGLLARRYHRQYLSSELRAERLERLSTQATLHTLRLQLDPHFLFNALNTISSQVESEPKLARRMIEHLGDLLRQTMETKDRLEVPLSEELALLEHYLAIQRIRFGDRLRFEADIDPGVRLATVPALLLQPLVENAIRHGLSARAAGGTVIVSGRQHTDGLTLEVQDDGVGFPTGWTPDTGAGLGLSITRQRLAAAYPGRSGIDVLPHPAGSGAIVRVWLPFHLAGEAK